MITERVRRTLFCLNLGAAFVMVVFFLFDQDLTDLTLAAMNFMAAMLLAPEDAWK